MSHILDGYRNELVQLVGSRMSMTLLKTINQMSHTHKHSIALDHVQIALIQALIRRGYVY